MRCAETSRYVASATFPWLVGIVRDNPTRPSFLSGPVFSVDWYFQMMDFLFGGAKRDRTADLLNAIQALSQLSYGPTGGPGITKFGADRVGVV